MEPAIQGVARPRRPRRVVRCLGLRRRKGPYGRCDESEPTRNRGVVAAMIILMEKIPMELALTTIERMALT